MPQKVIQRPEIAAGRTDGDITDPFECPRGDQGGRSEGGGEDDGSSGETASCAFLSY